MYKIFSHDNRPIYKANNAYNLRNMYMSTSGPDLAGGIKRICPGLLFF